MAIGKQHLYLLCTLKFQVKRFYMKSYLVLLLIVLSIVVSAQKQNPANDPEASALLQKVSEKYKAYKNISANFKLLTQRPKLKPEDDDRKYNDTLSGQILLQASKFKIAIKDQQIFCDGKNIWTYTAAEKEVQINYFEETDDVF
ncbi:MAG: hypothetical protein JWO06_2105, partial [Bacteroidota bacterium]|nr:hypothetical protein [Bacteroidota bacterium]